jgi:hypothetical protein
MVETEGDAKWLASLAVNGRWERDAKHMRLVAIALAYGTHTTSCKPQASNYFSCTCGWAAAKAALNSILEAPHETGPR